MKKILLTIGAIILVISSQIAIGEYFVSPMGKDSNTGTDEAHPFATIKHAVQQMVPGDTITVLPGEYFEQIHIQFIGDKAKATTIRAKIPHTVHLRGDKAATGFTAVPERPGVYVCNVEKLPEYVLERDTLQRFEKRPSISEVEHLPCSSFFDKDNGKVYVHCSDGKAPSTHTVTFSWLSGDAFRFMTAANTPHITNLHLDGFMFSGFNPSQTMVGASSTYSGIYIRKPSFCSIKNCISYMNGGGFVLAQPQDSLIENCITFCNSNEFNNSGGNIICYGPADRTIQRNILSFASKMAGLRFYGGTFDESWIEDCIAFDNGYDDIWIKYPSDSSGVRRCYASNAIHSRITHSSIFTSGDEYYNGKAKQSICRRREQKFNPDIEFADPANLDFHLQEDSRFRNCEGGDWGCAPFDDRILFVTPDGNDTNSGNSMRKPLKTLSEAARRLKNGGKIYITSGLQPENVTISNRSDIIICGRGEWPAVFSGTLKLDSCANAKVENINFLGNFKNSASNAMKIYRCAFANNVDIADKSDIRHCSFAKDITDNGSSFLLANIICGRLNGAPAFAGWNAFENLPPLANKTGHYSVGNFKAAVPQFTDASKGNFTLKNATQFAGISGDGFPIGQFRYIKEYAEPGIQTELGPVSATTANIFVKGETTSYTTMELFENGKSIAKLDAGDERYVYSLSPTGLKPNTKYTAKLKTVPDSRKTITNAPRIRQAVHEKKIEFTTLVEDQPVTYYVSNNGKNSNDGLTKQTAFQDIGAAARHAKAGDTIEVAGGTYYETVRMLTTGDIGKPITLRGAEGERVHINCGDLLIQGISIYNKRNINIDYLHIAKHYGNCSLWRSAGLFLRNSSDINITRVFYDAHNCKGQLSISAGNVDNLLLENFLCISGFSGFAFGNCKNLEIRNSVFLRDRVYHGYIRNTINAPAKVHHCIFAGHELQKVQNPLLQVYEVTTFTEHDNCFLVRVPPEEKTIFSFNKQNDKDLPENELNEILSTEWKRQGRFGHEILFYSEFCQKYKRQPTSIFADPMMPALPWFYRFKDLKDWHETYIKGNNTPEHKANFRRSNKAELGFTEDGKDRELWFQDYVTTNPDVLQKGIGLKGF